MMMGLQGRPEVVDGKSMQPLVAKGVQVMSMGFLVPEDQAMIWRGPMATGALEQMLRQTQWQDLDYLVVDLPPGTGDIQLTLAQRVPVTGALIVTTPQDIALIDARKAVAMFQKVGVPLLGLVENMAVYCCPNCGHEEHIFGADGGKAMAAKQGLAYLGALPLQRAIREQSDAGTPPVVAEPDGQAAQLYLQLARQAAVAVSRLAKDYAAKFPTISVSKST
jgi:ATP-binding protein involved in chromosome partitioning